jgi:hypothetical protein
METDLTDIRSHHEEGAPPGAPFFMAQEQKSPSVKDKITNAESKTTSRHPPEQKQAHQRLHVTPYKTSLFWHARESPHNKDVLVHLSNRPENTTHKH